MDEKIRAAMESSNPNDRVKAISDLLVRGDREALQTLSVIYQSDSDPDVRQRALDAGRAVKKNLDSGRVDPTKQKQIDRANMFKEQAMSAYVKEDVKTASANLRKAIQLNPDLRTESYVVSLASSITGEYDGDSVAELMRGSLDEQIIKEKKEYYKDESNWDKALTALAIYGLVNLIAAALGTVVLFKLFLDPTELPIEEVIPFLGDLLTVLVSGTGIQFISAMVVVSIGWMVSLIVNLFYWFGLYHISAHLILGGDGSFVKLVHRLANIATVTSSIAVLLVVGGLTYLVNTTDTTGTPVIVCLVCAAIYFVIVNIAYSVQIARIYDFGIGDGYATLGMAGIVSGVLGFVLNSILDLF